jgi:hypothetical protein
MIFLTTARSAASSDVAVFGYDLAQGIEAVIAMLDVPWSANAFDLSVSPTARQCFSNPRSLSPLPLDAAGMRDSAQTCAHRVLFFFFPSSSVPTRERAPRGREATASGATERTVDARKIFFSHSRRASVATAARAHTHTHTHIVERGHCRHLRPPRNEKAKNIAVEMASPATIVRNYFAGLPEAVAARCFAFGDSSDHGRCAQVSAWFRRLALLPVGFPEAVRVDTRHVAAASPAMSQMRPARLLDVRIAIAPRPGVVRRVLAGQTRVRHIRVAPVAWPASPFDLDVGVVTADNDNSGGAISSGEIDLGWAYWGDDDSETTFRPLRLPRARVSTCGCGSCRGRGGSRRCCIACRLSSTSSCTGFPRTVWGHWPTKRLT